MLRTITVKGVGRVLAKPDYVILSMSLKSKDLNYDRAMNIASQHIQHLTDTICAIGFKKSDLKTTRFNTNTDYNNVKDHDGNYHREFAGYVISHNLKLEFDFDMNKLSQALTAISECISHPELSVRFTVKDATAINEEMLRTATANAKRKAEILCEASNVELGQLLTINYNWDELDIFSHTQFALSDDRLYEAPKAKSIDIEPDDIDVSDTATFVWEIK
ncbi:MAG: SIMPL domain-containing protein [Ruminococcus sp.]|nr:SIMPL domain-containing protein [Ruminococcus sp.]